MSTGEQAAASDDSKSKIKQRLELVSWIAVALILAGLVVVVVGFAVPTHYEEQDNLTARQNERNVIYYYQLRKKMINCVMAGIVLLTLGSIVLSSALSTNLALPYCNCTGTAAADKKPAADG
ncbi:hypothetical protein BOX15_Mlig013151g1 [Macrostomum lignano]|uniref:Uncharacterized protein n=1 Tax=Macrostomum lignano TaxID=282301 RepID=A0A267DCA1_9PLAT|nr:hypothetical protein BOX15_Mlig013151g1 [Macrostomum lignano]